MVVVERFIEGDFLPGVGAEAAHIADDAGFDAAFDFVVGLVVADGIEEGNPFVLVWVIEFARDFGLPKAVFGGGILAFVGAGGSGAVVRPGDDRHTFGSLRPTVVNGFGAGDATAVHVHFGAVGKGVFDRVGIKVLVGVFDAVAVRFVMASAEALGFDGPGVFHPAEVVDVVDIEVAVGAAAEP